MDLLLPLLLVALLIPVFLNVRRQKREMTEAADMRDNLKIGDRVITTSGLYGTVVDLDDDSVDLEIAEEVVTTWLRKSILEVRTDDDATEDATTEAAPATAEELAQDATASDGRTTEAEGAVEAGDAPRLSKD